MARLIAYVDGQVPNYAKVEVARELKRGIGELGPAFEGRAPLIDWALFGNDHDELEPRMVRVLQAVTKSGAPVALRQVNDKVHYGAVRPASFTIVSMHDVQNLFDAWRRERDENRPD